MSPNEYEIALQAMEQKLQKLEEENSYLKITLQAENDRLERNTKLEKENIVLKEVIKEMSLSFKEISKLSTFLMTAEKVFCEETK